jgi:hypothetical protein
MSINDFNRDNEASAEKREYERSRLILDVHFDGADLTGVANTRDMSMGGVYMNTRADLPEGAILQLRIPFGGANEAFIKAQVMYNNPGVGVGLRFLELDDHSRAVLESELARK